MRILVQSGLKAKFDEKIVDNGVNCKEYLQKSFAPPVPPPSFINPMYATACWICKIMR